MGKIKIIIVDDKDVFRNALRLFIAKISDFEIVAEATNGKEFLDLLKTLKADIILMDLVMPVMDGIEATKKALKIHPGLKIIVLSTYGDSEYHDSLIKMGACGFLKKSSVNEELENFIRRTIHNKRKKTR